MVLGPLSDQTLERFRMYARRVKVLEGSFMPHMFKIEANTWNYLANVSGGSLIPSLRRLRASTYEPTDMEALYSLRSPFLTILALKIGQDYENQNRSFFHVIRKTSSLYSISVSGHLSKDLMVSVSGFHTLRRVELSLKVKGESSFTSELLLPVCDLPALEEIIITETFITQRSTAKEWHADGLPFKNLRKLFIRASPASILSILRPLQAPSLDNLEITLVDRRQSAPGNDEMPRMLLLLKGVAQELQNLRFSVSKSSPHSMPRITLPEDFIPSILKSQSLREVQIMDFVVSFGDEDVQLLSRLEWLRVLRIHTSCFEKPLTLSSLRMMAEKYPRLEVVEFTFDQSKKNINSLLDEIAQYPSTGHGLKRLIIGMAMSERIPGAHTLGVFVSQFLDHFFPSLVSVQAGFRGDAGWCSGINASLTAYRQVRAKLNNRQG